MQTFIVVAKSNSAAAKAVIEAMPDGSYYEFKSDTWFVQMEGTTQEVAKSLGFISGESGSGVVVPVANYSGRADADMWEWLKARLSKQT